MGTDRAHRERHAGGERAGDQPVCYAPDLLTLECFISAGGRFVLEVEDPSTELPIPGEAGPFDVHGRGLVIVEALADEWGAHLTDDMGGKVVWAAFDVPPQP
jgi:hypothetical protein